MTVEEAQERLTGQVLDLDGVVGTAVGECAGEPCLQVLVAADSDELRDRIPDSYEGYPVVIEVTGEIEARQ